MEIEAPTLTLYSDDFWDSVPQWDWGAASAAGGWENEGHLK